jgi:hypothetical protein
MAAEWTTAEDYLRQQFYDWEVWGRGWATWPEAVHLEPPFRAFRGHFLPQAPSVDDGRRHTLASRVISWFAGNERGTPSQELAPHATMPLPRRMEDDSPLRSFVLQVPRDKAMRTDAMAACLAALRGVRYPLAFEVVGTGGKIAFQVCARSADEQFVLAVFQSHFPDIAAVPGDLVSDWLDETDHGTVFGAFEAGLAREFMLPVRIVRSFDPDPLLAFTAAMDGLAANEIAAVQVLFEGAHAPWAESVFRAVEDGDGGDFFADAPEIARLGKQKAMQPLFAACIRVAAGGRNLRSANERATRLFAALARFDSVTGNHFFHLDDEVAFDRSRDFLERESHRSGMLLSLDELMSFVHLPSVSVQSPAILGRSGLRTRAIEKPPGHGIYLGENHHAGREAPVYLTLDQARRHVHVVGASGSGKSNLLLQILTDAIRQGGGVALLDPHGDLVDDLLLRIPEERAADVILFDPADTERPVGFNVLHAHSDLERTLLASDLVATFRRLSTSWGDQMHTVLANALQAFLESERGGTVADLRKFLIDREFREDFLTTIRDEEVVYYWRKEFPLLSGRPQGPILTRLDAFLRPKLVRHMVTQRENRVDFRAVMDEGKIFLAKLAQGAIGEENAALLGSFLLAKFQQTALSRQELRAADRRPFLVAADECQHFVTPSMAAILSGARKFGVGLMLFHQDLRQVERRDGEVYSALLANAGTRVVFRVGDHDARTLADGFAHFSADDLRALSVGEAICRFDRADHDFNLAVPLAPAADDMAVERRERIIAASRTKYGRPPVIDPGESAAPPATPEAPAPRATAVVRPSPPTHAPAIRPAAAASNGPTEVPLGRGGSQHKYLQELVKRFGEAQGYRATIEKPTPDGGSVDVALERDDGSIAVEISVTSTSAYESGNVAKCLAAGYGRVVVVAPERRRVDVIAKTVRATLHESQVSRVDFLLPEEFPAFLSALAPLVTTDRNVGGYKVKVSYKQTTGDDIKARQRAVAAVVARSVRKLEK